MRFPKTGLLPAFAAFSLLLGGCVYFNTYFNANKAYHQALKMREKRLAKNPEDSVNVSPEEKVKLERAINKCSKLLELYPDRLDYAPKALFLMGESYLLMEDYSGAVQKYDELARYYPLAPQNPLAEIHRAKALYLGGQSLKARAAVDQILKDLPRGEILREALLLAARMQVEGDSASAGLAYYEQLLEEKGQSAETRANLHWEAALLAFGLEQWERARTHALAPERKVLPDRFQYRNERMAVVCLYRLGRFAQGIREAERLARRKAYGPFRADMRLLAAQGYEGVGDWKTAERLYREVPRLSPRSSVAAESYYRLGEHFLASNAEDSARAYFDSAGTSGQSFEYGAKGAEKARALSRIAELRLAPPDSAEPHYSSFMIAELFLFDLSQVDSALARLDKIVQSPETDSVHTPRAAYARAYIREEFKKDTVAGDSLYRYVLEKFPNTEWAKQAEKNLGLKPTVQTDEDRAHDLFLAAEALRYGGADTSSQVVPAYRKVFTLYPNTSFAAKALFVMAFLREQQMREEPPVKGSLDSAKVAYHTLRTRYANTVYGRIAAAKMEKVDVSGAAADTAASSSSPPSAAPEAPEDTASEAGETPGRSKEVLEPKYENVDQY